MIAMEKEIRIATIFICVSINSEKVNRIFSELPILENIANSNDAIAIISGIINFLT